MVFVPKLREMLRDKHVPIDAFTELRFLKPLCPIEAAQAMITKHRYSLTCQVTCRRDARRSARPRKERRQRGLSEEQVTTIQKDRESRSPA